MQLAPSASLKRHVVLLQRARALHLSGCNFPRNFCLSYADYFGGKRFRSEACIIYYSSLNSWHQLCMVDGWVRSPLRRFSDFLNHVMALEGQVRGVPYVDNVRHIRAKTNLGTACSEQSVLVVWQDVLPPVARLRPASSPDHQSNQVKVNNVCAAIHEVGDNFATVFVDNYSNTASIPCSTFPEIGTIARHVLPRASCRFILALRTLVLDDFFVMLS